jgi:hypothetical protein
MTHTFTGRQRLFTLHLVRTCTGTAWYDSFHDISLAKLTPYFHGTNYSHAITDTEFTGRQSLPGHGHGEAVLAGFLKL